MPTEHPQEVSTEYQLHFGGDNELDANTLGYVLLNTVALVEEANKETTGSIKTACGLNHPGKSEELKFLWFFFTFCVGLP